MTSPESQGPLQNVQARWRVERAADGRVNFLLWWPGSEAPSSLPMGNGEASALVQGAGRVPEGSLDSLLWTGPDGPRRFPMSEEEAFSLVRGIDRVTSWAASSAEGTMTPGPATPDEVRRQLAIYGYIVVSPTIEAHTRLVAATPWASWVEEVPAPAGEHGIAWFVNVFAADDAQFGQAAISCGATRHPSAYVGDRPWPGGTSGE